MMTHAASAFPVAKPGRANRLRVDPHIADSAADAARERMASMPDLNRRFTEGDPDALRAVYREYGRAVFSVTYRVLQDRGLAEDATQQTFVKAWRNADRFDPDRNLAPWLFTIAKRVAIDVYRKEKRHRSDPLESHDVAVVPATFEGAWATWEVRRALDAIPEEERSVLEATYFLGLTHEEAASRLGVPLGTIKSRSHRAYRRLASLLAHLDEEASA